jgi:hypothetical protein
MEEKLVPRLMDRESVVQAFPLVRDLLPNVTLEQWLRFARPLLNSGSGRCPRGLMTIQNAASYILALFGFEVRESLTDTRALWIDNIIVPNIPGRDMIWEAVMDAADYLARMNGCRTIRAGFAEELDPANSERLWVRLSFERSGYSLDGVQAFKRLNPVPPTIHNH